MLGTEATGHHQDQMSQTLIVCLLFKKLVPIDPKFEGSWAPLSPPRAGAGYRFEPL